jgi:ATP-dependent Clp protease ATP-binding subunit ClpB
MKINQVDSLKNDPDLLAKYGRNLVDEIKKGKIDPIIGRNEEIRRVIKILSRKTKNNPILIGEPGVGKTAIAEGLASRIVEKDVPISLQNKTVYELDLASIVAGAKYRGEFEERLKTILNKIKESNGEIILFIDEVHQIVGAGRVDGALDASNMLKPMLARGELHCIGATTLSEYKKYIEKDTALERRFQKVMILEPNPSETISILRGLKSRFEAHHGVTIGDPAIIAAVQLSNRYISDRFLPDKAIDLIDEACASIRMEIDSMPSELDDMIRKITKNEIEKQALKKESDELSKNRLKQIEQDLDLLNSKKRELKSKWEKEKLQLKDIKNKKRKLEELKQDLQNSFNISNYEKAAEIQYKLIPEITNEIMLFEKENQSIDSLITEKVTEETIAEIVSKWTHIPVTKLMTGDKERIINLKKLLQKRVLGQDHALEHVSNAIIRQRAGIKDENKPIGTFLFLGPTGVGKTEVARALADVLFDSEKNMIRFDMSEFMEAHSISKFIGSPPGYIGHDEGGQLTESVRRKPYSILLFDEIEKAHPDIFNLLLQIMDDGRLTDNQGRTVDFKNTIIILTSNVGSSHILSKNEFFEERIFEDVKKTFKPEFLNRIDEKILFNSLNIKIQTDIAKKMLYELSERLTNEKISITFDETIIRYVIKNGYNEEYGARPIKRFIQRTIETFLAKKIISNELNFSDPFIISYKNDELVIKKNPN